MSPIALSGVMKNSASVTTNITERMAIKINTT